MRRLIFALALLPSVAMAQSQVTAGAANMALDGSEMFARMAHQISQDQAQIAQLQAQHEADAKALADAKATDKPKQ